MSSTVLAVPGSAIAAAVDISPTVAVDRFQARVTTDDDSSVLFWDGPDRYAVVNRGSARGSVSDGGLQTIGDRGGDSVTRRAFAAGPDGYTVLDLLDPSIETLLASARAGTTTLTPSRIETRAALRGSVRLGPNDCAGYRGGVKTIYLDAETLLPLRLVTRRGGARTQRIELTRLRVNRALPVQAFQPPRLGTRVFRQDQGFRRVEPSVAARNLPYLPKLPATVPAGFELAVSGWAPRSAITGAEGSIPRSRSLFAAVYARGVERIEITQRLSGGKGWPGDPFAGECQPLTETPATVGGIAATYAFGPETGPHLYWRDGGVLHTVSGPFPAADLVGVADSLTPVIR